VQGGVAGARWGARQDDVRGGQQDELQQRNGPWLEEEEDKILSGKEQIKEEKRMKKDRKVL
jgi:hypothetical protein